MNSSLHLVELYDANIGFQPKNITHLEAYPASNDIEKRCINIIARLFNAPLESSDSEAVGVSSLGSSEAIILAVLAAKRRWQRKSSILQVTVFLTKRKTRGKVQASLIAYQTW
jgi:glutamate decarboxylase